MTDREFGPELFAFLRELKDHNDRDWFNANKDRYENDSEFRKRVDRRNKTSGEEAHTKKLKEALSMPKQGKKLY